MPTLTEVAAVFTIVGGSLALIQLTAILVRVTRRPRLQLRVGTIRENNEDGLRTATVQVITTNSGSLSARNVLWNYDFPADFRVLTKEAELHERPDRVTVVRSLELLHPNVETHHELTVELQPDLTSFVVRYRIHLEDARPQIGVLTVILDQRGIKSSTSPT